MVENKKKRYPEVTITLSKEILKISFYTKQLCEWQSSITLDLTKSLLVCVCTRLCVWTAQQEEKLAPVNMPEYEVQNTEGEKVSGKKLVVVCSRIATLGT